MTKVSGLRVAVDIGGTFTDTVLVDAHGTILSTNKTPTTPTNPTLGALEGVSLVLQDAGHDWRDLTGFIHGTTLATNALIERRGARVATITSAGFRDILEIGYERRYSQYDINLQKPDLLVPRSRAFTVGGRITATGDEYTPLDEIAVAELVRQLEDSNAEAVAICLLHAYANPTHEHRLKSLLQAQLPDVSISISSEVSPEAREFDRLCTTIANAYIQPLMASYLEDFQTRFSSQGVRCPILMMTAGGGMTTLKTAAALPIRLVESGPAGGAILAARIAAQVGAEDVLSFDMGGTTAKLCLIDQYQPQSARRFEIARAARFIKGSGMPVRIPVLEMIEIGAGGGSIASVDRLGRLQVGPESAGSEPGPAAFSKGGTLATVTDADVVQGLIEPSSFAEGRLAIDAEAASQAINTNIAEALETNIEAAAAGLSEIVDENMAAAGRMHAVESGKDLGARTMIAFGGNGPLHATRVARRAGVSRILVPNDPGVGSAVGFLFAPVSFEIVRSRYSTLEDLDVAAINAFLGRLIQEASDVVRAGAPEGHLEITKSAFMRYRGQGHEIEIPLPSGELQADRIAELQAAFEAEYSAQFSRAVPGMTVEILNWFVRVASRDTPPGKPSATPEVTCAPPNRQTSVFCEVTSQRRPAAIYDRAALSPGTTLQGPALIVEPQTTTYVSADFSAKVDALGNILLLKKGSAP
ncbi:hydantoinase/oxoprolinase family protein [Roseovarius rhodophyticola]|uniref:Hydantoinase/oxoprolinase family protein n=1 Tax=Roseovarius rhodophyticola TaxID=3080827 RepID=A0ABZ2TIT0_9RHOB|nr:hydantoinase/oxoprolinase family protein [Roseovarius sp. W115]MDV2929963.1 hydantoinase/oxoprolinase family protein [Roseovarius sp. W115]